MPNTDFRIIQLEDNKTLAASTQEIVQEFSGLTILSSLKYEGTGKPATNVNVLLVDENGMVLKRGRTDNSGNAKFELLDPDRDYNVVIDKNDPQLEAHVLKSGKELTLKKKEMVQRIGGYALLSHIEYNESTAPASDIYVLLLDDDGFVLKKGKTDAKGVAVFEDINQEERYQVIIDKNHPSLNVDVKLNGQVIAVDVKRILENFKKLSLLSRISYANSDEPATDIAVVLVDENGLVLKKGSTNENGIAMFVMPDDNKKYTIMIDKDMVYNSSQFEMTNSYKFNNVYFDFNSDQVRKEAFATLNQLANILKNETTKKVVIHAHTDALGSDIINQNLAERRGVQIKQYLVSKGIDEKRIVVDPVGHAEPIASNDIDTGRQLNRRVEFELMN